MRFSTVTDTNAVSSRLQHAAKEVSLGLWSGSFVEGARHDAEGLT